ncbi:helix-turn-helix domain-containing protein [Sporomusa sp.]|jgi:DNA-binding HxlR family transcriptional regulator|uniref:winged helix-turn-helix transcriptional regulator n=1 Tax=Sporomusa sp. TaxID=2078658 RepID=UPI002BED3148|nr:helix-turn-helix domain-containing protein [Sporomusa sp.]MDF2873477.1 transcriptional regulator, HxlR family [Sporomusa sp.]HWR07815.1 helix-turn-helix domain-containing protein [Sporomusa sp.]
MSVIKICPIEEALNLIGHKWKVLIIRNLLAKDTQRFSDLLRGINGISQKMLTQQLRQLEQDGLISRLVYAEVPPKVEYSLTELGRSLQPILESISLWGKNYLGRSNKGIKDLIDD